MSSIRLNTVAPDLVHAIQKQSPAVLPATASTVAELIFRELRLAEPQILEGLAALDAGRFGGSVVREQVKTLFDSFDVQAWGIQAQIDSGDATEEQYEAVFDQARAANSLWYALDDDALVAALESAYEAQAARGIDAVRKIVHTIIDG